MKNFKNIFLLTLLLPIVLIAQKPQLVIQSGFQSEATHGAISPDKKLVCTNETDNTLILWDLRTGRQLQSFKEIVWAVFSNDSKALEVYDTKCQFRTIDFNGKTIANQSVRNNTTTKVGTVLYKSRTNSEPQSTWLIPEEGNFFKNKDINTYTYAATSYEAGLKYDLKNNFLTVCKSSSNIVQLYNANTGIEAKSLTFSGVILKNSYDNLVYSQFSSDGNFLLAGDKYMFEILEVNTGRSVFKYKHPTLDIDSDQINMANFSPDNKNILIVTSKEIKTIEMATNKILWKSNTSLGDQGFGKRANIQYTPDNKMVLIGFKKAFYILNAQNGAIISKLFGVAQKNIDQILLRKNNLAILQNDTLALWNLALGGIQKIIPAEIPNRRLTTNSTGEKFYYYGNELDIKTQKWTKLEEASFPQDTPNPPNISMDDKYGLSLARFRVRDANNSSGTIIVENLIVHDLTTKKIVWKKPKIANAVFGNKSLIIAANPEFDEAETRNEIYILDGKTGNSLRTITISDAYHYLRDFTFSANDTYLTFDTDIGCYIMEMASSKITKIEVKLGQLGNEKTFSKDEKLMFIKTDDGFIQTYDIAQQRIIQEKATKEIFNMISVSTKTDNGRFYFARSSNDGFVNLWDLNKKAIVAQLYSFTATGDWAVITPDGRFDGTKGALKNMYYVRDVNTFPLEILYEKFYTPKLLVRILNGEEFPPVDNDFIELHKAPIAKISYEQKTRNLTVEDDTKPSYNNTTGLAEITINASAENDKIDEIRLFHNGKIVNLATRGLFVTDNTNGTDSKKYTINLLAGQNTFRAIALNSQRTESTPDEILVNYQSGNQPNTPIVNVNGVPVDAVDKNATMHIIVVGINKYQNNKLSLNYALADATSFKDELEKDAKSVLANVKTYFVTDNAANKNGITEAFAQVQKLAKPQDVFVFYYAGHGVISEKNKEFYLVPTDVSDLNNVDAQLAEKGISSKMLQTYAVDIQAQKQLFILDACQSAGAFEKLLTNDANQQKSLAVVARSTGTHWLAASGSQQFANEFATLGHGAFTYVLLNALKGQAAANKMITVNGLKNFLQSGVPDLMKKYGGTAQYPSSYGLGNDFPVEVLKN
jgi:WD40 repeat protein